MQKDLILIGGGHAHMVTIANIQNIVKSGHRVTVIGPSNRETQKGYLHEPTELFRFCDETATDGRCA